VTDWVRWATEKLNYSFSDTQLLQQALTHRSASRLNNERLEFLGDSLLNFAVARRLYALRPEASEGDLSRARAALVRKSTLAALGRELEVDRQLILGSGELQSGGAQRSSALADAIEALVGAVLIDGGFDAADGLVGRMLVRYFDELPDSESLKDPKTRLQEWLQAQGLSLPQYSVIDVKGKDHRQVFTVQCEIEDGNRESRGNGSSRRAAEQDAAERLLAMLNG
jgi:ribonuclease-3